MTDRKLALLIYCQDFAEMVSRARFSHEEVGCIVSDVVGWMLGGAEPDYEDRGMTAFAVQLMQQAGRDQERMDRNRKNGAKNTGKTHTKVGNPEKSGYPTFSSDTPHTIPYDSNPSVSIPCETIQSYVAGVVAAALRPADMEQLNAHMQDFPAEVIRYAADTAAANGSPRWSYIDGILRRYAASGIDTLDKAKADTEQHRARKAAGTKYVVTDKDLAGGLIL